MSNIIKKDRFAIRLRRERERLGLTQQEFADKLGVNRMSQVNYESGKRYPGEEYFENMNHIEGIDTFYLIFGMYAEDISSLTLGAQALIQAIERELELKHNDFGEAWEEATRCAAINVEEDSPSSSKDLAETVEHYTKEVLSHSPVLINENALLDVLQGIEEAISRNNALISPVKKARMILMLYRQHRAFGYIEQVTIEDAIVLASEK